MQDEKLMNAGDQVRRLQRQNGEIMSERRPGAQDSSGAAGERLRDYDRMKLELASLVQNALHLIDRQAEYDAYQKCRELLANLAADRFTLAVVGQFNRGKSSLMNAVLGMDRLPVGVVPLTSVITKVSYGNPERVLIEFRGSSLKDEIPLERLGEFVTEAGNPGNQKQITAAEIQLPSEFLRRGLFFVDTPGVGSAITANTETTERFLPQADAVIFVTSFDSPLGREELEFLQKVREHVRKIFFVVNKLDLVASANREQVLAFIRERLEHGSGLREPRLFAVSALVGLEAKLSGSKERLAESGLPALEESLVGFLTTEKTREFLVRTCDRALSLLSEVGAGPALPEKRERAWMGTYDQFVAKEAGHDLQTLKGERPALSENLLSRLVDLRGELLEDDGGGDGKRVSTQRSVESRSEAELMVAVRRPCQVCARVAHSMMKFMAKFQHQIVINENERATLARHGGLCPLHTWQYAEIGSPQGISASYPRVLMELSNRLNYLARSQAPGNLAEHAKSLLARGERCSACREQALEEEKAIDAILEKVNVQRDDETVQLPVLCLPHLSALLRKVPDGDLARSLLDFEAALLERLAENMKRYALKHDALRRDLNSDDERVAYHRSLSHLVGDKRLQAPWHVEYLL
jgi:GTP-binding protein EngB required for normal cell division